MMTTPEPKKWVRSDDDEWDIVSSVGYTALVVAAWRRCTPQVRHHWCETNTEAFHYRLRRPVSDALARQCADL
jgi:hypothetical protein